MDIYLKWKYGNLFRSYNALFTDLQCKYLTHTMTHESRYRTYNLVGNIELKTILGLLSYYKMCDTLERVVKRFKLPKIK